MTSIERVVTECRRTAQGVGHSEGTRNELRAALENVDLLADAESLSVRELSTRLWF